MKKIRQSALLISVILVSVHCGPITPSADKSNFLPTTPLFPTADGNLSKISTKTIVQSMANAGPSSGTVTLSQAQTDEFKKSGQTAISLGQVPNLDGVYLKTVFVVNLSDDEIANGNLNTFSTVLKEVSASTDALRVDPNVDPAVSAQVRIKLEKITVAVVTPENQSGSQTSSESETSESETSESKNPEDQDEGNNEDGENNHADSKGKKMEKSSSEKIEDTDDEGKTKTKSNSSSSNYILELPFGRKSLCEEINLRRAVLVSSEISSFMCSDIILSC
jgi:hypothetical protein